MSTPMRPFIKTIASLKLTVALLALTIVLVFAGTLAQVDAGIWTVMSQYFRTPIAWIELSIFFPRAWNVGGAVPFPGGFVIGLLLLVNLVAAHTLHIRRNSRRWGVLLIHVGVILLLLGELVTALWAVESQMTIDEGSFANYTEDIREVELAIIDPQSAAHPDHDRVVAIPASMLREGRTIEHPALPFAIRIDEYMINSQVMGPFQAQQAGVTARPLATQGVGVGAIAVEVPPVSGTEQQVINAATGFVTLLQGDKALGTWMISLYITGPQRIEIDGRIYLIELRFRREYKDYQIHLLDFRHDKYTGTEIPHNFSSEIRLIHPAQNEDRKYTIYMNNPLRYNGETFYQAAFKNEDRTTILQVVRNPGWLLPYIACVIVAVGMVYHFGHQLTKFLAKQETRAESDLS